MGVRNGGEEWKGFICVMNQSIDRSIENIHQAQP